MSGRPRTALLVALALLVASLAAGVVSVDTSPGTAVQGSDDGARVTASQTGPGESADGGGTVTGTNHDGVDGRDDRVAVWGGSLPVDADRVFDRVEALLGVDATAPSVTVTGASASSPASSTYERPLFAVTGMDTGGWNGTCGLEARASARRDEVRIDPGTLDAAAIELVLAHEFAHVIQRQQGATARQLAYSTERRWIGLAVQEGTAVAVAQAYAERHGARYPGNRTPLAARECIYRRATGGFRLVAGLYHFGAQYVTERTDDLADFEAVAENPPRSGATVLAGERPAEMGALTVATRPGEGWSQRDRDSYGPLLLRPALAGALNRTAGARATDGWANGTAVTLSDGSRSVVVWATRWTSPTEAGEFAAVARRFADRRDEDGDVRMAVRRASPDVVVLLAATDGPLPAATVAADNGTVTVTFDGD